ncbi:hypothetical protein AURDEDRAFT_155910 [Auricularia subglabra TFB-10046 SS5]|nr:hypothetical protein AURDEDRAFT_155910 [Auricularia subglabra TFB-10046 SS5]
MSPSTLFPLSDITTKIGYREFVSKLRLLEIERAGADLRAAAGVPDLKDLIWQPNTAAPAPVSTHEIAIAAFRRNSRNTESVKRLLSILRNGPTPALSRSTSQSSGSGSSQASVASEKMTIHDIAEAAYKRNSRNTDNVQFLLSILKHGVPPSLSRSLSNSTASSLGASTHKTLSSASSICLPDCADEDECDLLKESWERAEKWVDELVDDE